MEDTLVTETDNRRVRTSITIRPDVLERSRALASHKNLSLSRLIEDVLSAQFPEETEVCT